MLTLLVDTIAYCAIAIALGAFVGGQASASYFNKIFSDKKETLQSKRDLFVVVLVLCLLPWIGYNALDTSLASAIGLQIVQERVRGCNAFNENIGAILAMVVWIFMMNKLFNIPVSLGHAAAGGLVGARIAIGGWNAIYWNKYMLYYTVSLLHNTILPYVMYLKVTVMCKCLSAKTLNYCLVTGMLMMIMTNNGSMGGILGILFVLLGIFVGIVFSALIFGVFIAIFVVIIISMIVRDINNVFKSIVDALTNNIVQIATSSVFELIIPFVVCHNVLVQDFAYTMMPLICTISDTFTNIGASSWMFITFLSICLIIGIIYGTNSNCANPTLLTDTSPIELTEDQDITLEYSLLMAMYISWRIYNPCGGLLLFSTMYARNSLETFLDNRQSLKSALAKKKNILVVWMLTPICCSGIAYVFVKILSNI